MLRAIAIATIATSALACGFLVDTSNLTGGDSLDGGASDSAPSDDGGSGIALDGALEGSVTPTPAIGCPAAGHTCVPEPPDGWIGPLLVYNGPEDSVPDCPASMALARVDAHTGFGPPPAHTCSACACAAGSGATCAASLFQSNNATCSSGRTSSALTTSCTDLTASGFTVSFTSTGGSCPPIGGVATHPPPNWANSTRACGAPSLLRTGCPSGNVCTPDSPTPFKARHCISTVNDVACPAGPYTEKLLVIASLDDQRACSKCACGTPENKCAGNAHLYFKAGCSGTNANVPLPEEACNQPPAPASIRLVASNSAAPKCEPTGPATPTGTINPKTFGTVCCAP